MGTWGIPMPEIPRNIWRYSERIHEQKGKQERGKINIKSVACCRLRQQRIKPPYPGTLHFEVFVRRLRIRIVSQGVSCVLRVGFCGWLLSQLCLFPNPRGSSFYVCVYVDHLHISVSMYHLPKWHMM